LVPKVQRVLGALPGRKRRGDPGVYALFRGTANYVHWTDPEEHIMARKVFLWGVSLTVAGWLLFRVCVFRVLPAPQYPMDLRQIWEAMTVSQKLMLTGLELPFFAGLLCLVVSFFMAISKK
jgi:hypothetical protein